MNLMESIMEWRPRQQPIKESKLYFLYWLRPPMEFMKLLVGVAVFAAGGGYGLAGQPRAPPKGRQANPNNQQQMNGIEEWFVNE